MANVARSIRSGLMGAYTKLVVLLRRILKAVNGAFDRAINRSRVVNAIVAWFDKSTIRADEKGKYKGARR